MRPDHRAALVLRHVGVLSYAEIAEVLDVPVGTAKGWTSRGRAAMLVAMNAGENPAIVPEDLRSKTHQWPHSWC